MTPEPEAPTSLRANSIDLAWLQQRIATLYGAKDRERGPEATFLWLAEEVGELAAAIRLADRDRANLEAEFADVLAWLATLANLLQVDLATAVYTKYGAGCPGCHAAPCECQMSAKP